MKRVAVFRAGFSDVRRRFRPAHGGADFGQHTAAQIFAKIPATTRRPEPPAPDPAEAPGPLPRRPQKLRKTNENERKRDRLGNIKRAALIFGPRLRQYIHGSQLVRSPLAAEAYCLLFVILHRSLFIFALCFHFISFPSCFQNKDATK